MLFFSLYINVNYFIDLFLDLSYFFKLRNGVVAKISFFQAEKRNVQASLSEPGHFFKAGKNTLAPWFPSYITYYGCINGVLNIKKQKIEEAFT